MTETTETPDLKTSDEFRGALREFRSRECKTQEALNSDADLGDHDGWGKWERGQQLPHQSSWNGALANLSKKGYDISALPKLVPEKPPRPVKTKPPEESAAKQTEPRALLTSSGSGNDRPAGDSGPDEGLTLTPPFGEFLSHDEEELLLGLFADNPDLCEEFRRQLIGRGPSENFTPQERLVLLTGHLLDCFQPVDFDSMRQRGVMQHEKMLQNLPRDRGWHQASDVRAGRKCPRLSFFDRLLPVVEAVSPVYVSIILTPEMING
jgi:hypothetical protein